MYIPALLKSSEKIITDNAPTILTAVGVVGTIGTAVLAGKASWTAAERLLRLKTNTSYGEINAITEDETGLTATGIFGQTVKLEPLDTRTALKAVLPLYIPAVAVGAGTITCVIFANKINAGRLAGMAAAYALGEGKIKDYKSKVEELMGVEKKNEVEDKIAVDKVNQAPKVMVIGDGTGKGLYYDSFSARPFWATRTELDAARNAVMLEVLNNGRADLNKWFNEIGLEETGYGETVGWTERTPFELHIRPSMDTGDRPMAYVDYDTETIGRYNHQ